MSRHAYASRDSSPSHILLDQKLDLRVHHMEHETDDSLRNETPNWMNLTDDYTYYYTITDDYTIGNMFDGDNTTMWYSSSHFDDQVKTVNVVFHVSTSIWVDDSIRDSFTKADPHQKKFEIGGPQLAPSRPNGMRIPDRDVEMVFLETHLFLSIENSKNTL